MSEKNAKSKKAVKPKAAHVTVDSKKYRVNPVFRFKGNLHLATDAVKDKELIASLIEAKSFVIQEVAAK